MAKPLLCSAAFLFVSVHGTDFEVTGEAKKFYAWSRYRYTKFDDNNKPNLGDRQSIILAGGDVKCEVCDSILSTILEEMVKKKKLGTKSDQENVLDFLESEFVDEKKVEQAKSEMEMWVEKNYKGCNKWYKEGYLAKGLEVQACHKLPTHKHTWVPGHTRIPWACSKVADAVPAKEQMEVYSVQKEAAHYACEETIGRYKEDLADWISEKYSKKKAQAIIAIAKEACRKVAKCEERKKDETLEARLNMTVSKTKERNFDANLEIDGMEKEIKKFKKEKKQKEKVEKKAKKEEKKAKKDKDDEDDGIERVEL